MEEAAKWQLAVWAAAAALIVIVAVRVLGPGDGATPPPVRVQGGAGLGGGRAGVLYVHVAGEVRRPGLYRVTAGARVAVALERAGGPLRRAELSAVNLAAPVEDGQQIVVPRRGPAGAAPAAPASGAPAVPGTAPTTPLSLAGATVEDLDAIDGLGPTLAGRIIEFRDQQGGVGSVDELAEVDGIGEKRLATLREALRP